jgi:hypothetical protein
VLSAFSFRLVCFLNPFNLRAFERIKLALDEEKQKNPVKTHQHRGGEIDKVVKSSYVTWKINRRKFIKVLGSGFKIEET